MYSLLIIVPLVLVFILNLPPRNVMRRAAVSAAIAYTLAQAAFAVLWHLGALDPWSDYTLVFFRFTLNPDGLAALMVFAISLVAFAALLTAQGTIDDRPARARFTSLLLLAVTGMNGTVLLSDLFSLYVFLEVTGVASFILIAMNREGDGLEGAFKYLVLSAIATGLMLSALALLFMLAGGTGFDSLRSAVSASGDTSLVKLALALYVAGLLVKGGVVPFHWWLPDAYSSAPAPASVLLAGIVTKVSGVYTLIRICSAVFGYDGLTGDILRFAGAFSIVAGALAAMGQRDMKRMLAYSSISQVGYIILGFACATPLGVAGAAFHIFNHATFKSLLFVNSSSVERSTGTRDMESLGGLSKVMPVTGASSLLAFCSAAGIPPLAGFWSKLIIIIALWQVSMYAYAVIAAVAGVITMAYFLILQRKVFFGKIAPAHEGLKEPGTALGIASVVLSLVTVGAGIFSPYVIYNIILPIGRALTQ